jgi:hypothetical protein
MFHLGMIERLLTSGNSSPVHRTAVTPFWFSIFSGIAVKNCRTQRYPASWCRFHDNWRFGS